MDSSFNPNYFCFDDNAAQMITPLEHITTPNYNALQVESIGYSDEYDPDLFLNNETDFKIPNSIHLFEDEINYPMHDNSISFMNWNIRSIPTNFKTFKDLLYIDNVFCDILSFCETRLTTDLENLYTLPNYTVFHEHRDRHGGGASLFIKDYLKPKLLSNMSFTSPGNVEVVSASIEVNGMKLFISSVYRPPSGDIEVYLSKMEELLVFARDNDFTKYYIMGDMNVNLLNNTDNDSADLLNLMSSYAVYPMITKVTRPESRTLLDHMWTNDVRNIIQSYILLSDITDHYPCITYFRYKQNLPKYTKVKYEQKRRFGDQSKIEFVNRIRDIDWTEVMNESEVDVAYTKFHERFMGVFQECFPLKNTKIKHDKTNSPYLTTSLKKCMKECTRLNRLAKNRPLSFKERYLRYKSILHESLKTAEQNYYKEKFQSVSGNAKRTWQNINTVLNRKKYSSETLIDTPGTIPPADFINKYFVEAIDKIKSKIPADMDPDAFKHFLPDPTNFSMITRSVNPDEIKKIAMNVKTNACGYDEIPPAMIKLTIDYLLAPLTHLINLTLKSGVFPSLLKVAKVITLHKSGDKSQISNKRPVSLLNSFSKIFEKVIFERINNYLEKFSLLIPNQHGFRKGFSTESATIQFLDNIYSAIFKKKFTIGLFLDFSKAFDCIEHRILKVKLDNLGIRGKMNDLICNYLENRSQRVSYNNTYSEPQSIKYGVPQGSILGPLLFSIYINDIINASTVLKQTLYADDGNSCLSGENPDILVKNLNQELVLVRHWVIANRLLLNADKSVYILFSSKPFYGPLRPVRIGPEIINRVFSTKFLGLILDCNLSWELHILSLCNKLSKINGVLYQIRKKLSRGALLSVYYSLCYSLITYGITIWGGTCAKYVNKVYMRQKQLLRTITFSNKYCLSTPIFNELRILKLHNVYKLFVCILGYKVVFMNYSKNTFQIMHHVHRTRGANYMMVIPNNQNCSILSRSIFCNLPRIWNEIYRVALDSIHVVQFKNKIRLQLFADQL